MTGRLRPEPYKIGRFMDFREFRWKMDDAGFEYRHFIGIGLGPVKFNRRALLADVSLWVYSKPAA